jgi:hypothetical protein
VGGKIFSLKFHDKMLADKMLHVKVNLIGFKFMQINFFNEDVKEFY